MVEPDSVDPLDIPFPLADFVAVLRRSRGIPKTYSALYRWVTDGVSRERGAEKIPLPTKNIGGIRHVTLRMYDEWQEKLQ